MIYPANFEHKIKFDIIRQKIKDFCLSDMGRTLVEEEMTFSSNEAHIRKQLTEALEFMHILKEEDDFPSDHILDARPFLQKIKVEGLFLEIPEMVILKNSLTSIAATIHFFNNRAEHYPLLCQKAQNIHIFPYIQQRLDSIISKFGTIKDNASPELNEIRSQLRQKQAGISKRLQALLQQAQADGWADKDSSLAIRDGRMVIPVPAAYKRKINGIIHDESATGKTAYIEPTEIVATNNEIRELELKEKREIIRILKKFADDIRPYIEDLFPAYDFLAFIDYIRGKATFSNYIEAIVPEFSNNPEIFWSQARHPLLWLNFKNTGKKLIPLNLEINEEDRIIVISGPNAGGKSVCLQTVGLLQYMFQCGLPIPVSEASKLGIFEKILIDIGDEQSIENDLSTYSSHLVNMKNFLKNKDSKTLVLIDEFGSGTEPMLGGAIAQAILASLNEAKVKGVITTHYTNLKHFAAETPGIINGAMLYDSHNMLPLFELRLGKPGSSFAFEIAKKIGLPKEILDNAAAQIGENHINYDKHLKDIARDKRYWEEKRKKIHENEKRLEEIIEKYDKELNETSKIRKEIIQEAQAKAQEIITSANKTIERTIQGIKEHQAEKEKTRLLRLHLEEEKQKLLSEKIHEEERINKKIEKLKQREKNKKTIKNNQSSSQQPIDAPVTETILKKGDIVCLPNKSIGEIIEINKNYAMVALGNLQSNIPISQLKKISINQSKKLKNTTTPQTSYSNIQENISQKRLTFKTTIDLRGMRGEDALQQVTTYLDEAVMLNFKEVRVLHGTGTGILRQLIREFLRNNPLVQSFHDEQIQLGGAGITVIQLNT